MECLIFISYDLGTLQLHYSLKLKDYIELQLFIIFDLMLSLKSVLFFDA